MPPAVPGFLRALAENLVDFRWQYHALENKLTAREAREVNKRDAACKACSSVTSAQDLRSHLADLLHHLRQRIGLQPVELAGDPLGYIPEWWPCMGPPPAGEATFQTFDRELLRQQALLVDGHIPCFGARETLVEMIDLAHRPHERDDSPGLLSGPWTRASDRWATATPVLPKKLLSRESEEILAKGCERVGLPRPAHVVVTRVSSLSGAPPAFAYAAPHQDGKPPRPLVHALLLFHEPVAGPVLLGAGRYQGLGLCRPLEDDEAEARLGRELEGD